MPNVCIHISSRINNLCNGIIRRKNERNIINSLCIVFDITRKKFERIC